VKCVVGLFTLQLYWRSGNLH